MQISLSYIDTKEYMQQESVYIKWNVEKMKTLFGDAYKGGKAIKESKEMIDHSRWNSDLFCREDEDVIQSITWGVSGNVLFLDLNGGYTGVCFRIIK